MIIFNIVLEDEEKAARISAYLIEKKYAMQTHIDTNKILTTSGQKQTVRLFFITKSLLYVDIEKEVKDLFFTEGMIIYGTPVSHIDKDYGELLRNYIKAG
jgi:hypothetical protein